MRWRKKIKNLVLLGIVVSLVACLSTETESPETLDPNNTAGKGQIKFCLKNVESTDANVLNNETIEIDLTPAKVYLEFHSVDDSLNILNKTIGLTPFGNSYITEDVFTLDTGSYYLSRFEVLNSSGDLIYSAPKENSPIANLLDFDNPLKFHFLVKDGEIKSFNIDVHRVLESTDAENFGYPSFVTQVIGYNKFFIRVLVLDNIWKFSTATIKVYCTNNDSVNVVVDHLSGYGINKIVVPKADNYDIFIEKVGYVTQNLGLSESTLKNYTTSPLVIKMVKVDDADWFLADGERGIIRRQKWWEDLDDDWKKIFIKELYFSTENDICPSDVELQELFKLQEFNFSDYEIKNLDGLKNLTNLKTLDCSSNNLTSLAGIENLFNLTDLNCSSNNLTSLTGIDDLFNLTDLNCSSNNLTSLTGIDDLFNLTDLNCSFNLLTSLKGIEKLQYLESLSCNHNALSSNSLDVLVELESISYVNCRENSNITTDDISFLKEMNNKITIYSDFDK